MSPARRAGVALGQGLFVPLDRRRRAYLGADAEAVVLATWNRAAGRSRWAAFAMPIERNGQMVADRGVAEVQSPIRSCALASPV